MKEIEAEYLPKFKYFKIRKIEVKTFAGMSPKVMIIFNDVSLKILHDSSKAEGELLTLINSTISHEMRNPLNSIIN